MYKGRKVLVLGGFGFIGLNLLRKLLEQEALVTVLDIRDEIPLKSLQKINYQKGDLRDSAHLRRLLDDQEIVFNLAGRSGPGNSNQDPREDLEVNCLGALNVLEVARQLNTGIKIVFPGSRLEYGKVTRLPVTEKTEMRPTSIYGIHKLTAEKYHLAYYDNFGLRTTVLRISNPYGPHLPQPNPGYNIINFFFDEALRGQTLKIFGDGTQKRD